MPLLSTESNNGDDRRCLHNLVSDLKTRCNRHLNGECQSLICLQNGGYERGMKPDYSVATCEVHEQVEALINN